MQRYINTSPHNATPSFQRIAVPLLAKCRLVLKTASFDSNMVVTVSILYLEVSSQEQISLECTAVAPRCTNAEVERGNDEREVVHTCTKVSIDTYRVRKVLSAMILHAAHYIVHIVQWCHIESNGITVNDLKYPCLARW